MQIVVWIMAGGGLLVAASFLASVIDRRAGWNRIPLELDGGAEREDLRIPER